MSTPPSIPEEYKRFPTKAIWTSEFLLDDVEYAVVRFRYLTDDDDPDLYGSGKSVLELRNASETLLRAEEKKGHGYVVHIHRMPIDLMRRLVEVASTVWFFENERMEYDRLVEERQRRIDGLPPEPPQRTAAKIARDKAVDRYGLDLKAD